VADSLLRPGGHRAEAIEFLLDAYRGVATQPGKGLPHAQAVADILRESGCDEQTELVGLLHDVVEDTGRTVDDVRLVFADEVADMVAALTEDTTIAHHSPRKRRLRGTIAAAGSPAVDVALADKIATLQYAQLTDTPVTRLKLAHYRATLQLALAAGVAVPLCRRLESLLAGFV